MVSGQGGGSVGGHFDEEEVFTMEHGGPSQQRESEEEAMEEVEPEFAQAVREIVQ